MEVTRSMRSMSIEAQKLKQGDEVRAVINGVVSTLKVVNLIKLSGMSDYVIIQYEQFWPYPIEIEGDQEVTIIIRQ